MSENLREYLDFAVETAYRAGRGTLAHFQTGVRPDVKADHTPVTIADLEAEKLIRGRIEQCYPHHAVLGEEYGLKDIASATHRWLIDPIDGTRAFVRGVPLYGVLLGLEIEGRVEVGAAYFPALDEMVAAATGEGCWWNGRRAHVSRVSTLKDATVAFTDVAKFEEYGRDGAWKRFMEMSAYRAGWSDAYGYALVATGRVELMLDPVMNPWDCAPFPPIVKEAGGFFGNWQGEATIYGNEALATSQVLLPEVLAVIRQGA